MRGNRTNGSHQFIHFSYGENYRCYAYLLLSSNIHRLCRQQQVMGDGQQKGVK